MNNNEDMVKVDIQDIVKKVDCDGCIHRNVCRNIDILDKLEKNINEILNKNPDLYLMSFLNIKLDCKYCELHKMLTTPINISTSNSRRGKY